MPCWRSMSWASRETVFSTNKMLGRKETTLATKFFRNSNSWRTRGSRDARRFSLRCVQNEKWEINMFYEKRNIKIWGLVSYDWSYDYSQTALTQTPKGSETQQKIKKISDLVTFFTQCSIWPFHIAVLQRRAKKCIRIIIHIHSHALFCSWNLLFNDFPVALLSWLPQTPYTHLNCDVQPTTFKSGISKEAKMKNESHRFERNAIWCNNMRKETTMNL